MAAENGRKSADLSAALVETPGRFDFFQAVRLLERVVRQRALPDAPAPRQSVGRDVPPEQEVVRFKAEPSLSFPPSPIAGIQLPADGAAAEMRVSFLGLTGPCGVLPQHYTVLLLQRLRERDYSLRDFFDLFNHRLVSLFYRAWEKYRLPFAHERWQLEGGDAECDLPTWALYCLVGLGTAHLRGRMQVADQAFLFYAGHFARQMRSAVVLESVLEDYFELPMRVQQLQGEWMYLDPADQSRMPGLGSPEGCNNRLGLDVVAGARVWEVQSKFRLRVGPLTFAQFRRLMPNGDTLRPLCQFTRTYVGPELAFDVQAVLLGPETPWCRLGAAEGEGALLGWNTWVRSGEFRRDVDDAVFMLESI